MNIYLIIIVLMIFLYIYCYFIYPNYISILQTSLKEFEFNLLFKKQPLVIQDKLKDVLSILQAWFSPNIINDTIFDKNKLWNINKYKYLYCYALEDTEILLYSPKNKVINDTPNNDEPIIEIKLKKSQSLIIPYHWYYNIKNIDSIKLYGIHDYITYLINIFI